ncbi:hypothetical protein [Sulfurisoma sediminicola]|uniref:hypothetical protein n=1 Tax=Sulfurisoma sediminicola TaxID=1381557 RepID=UPI000F60E6E0|nr:hypothetical protein [Sulfurisoma sediminicola]
MANEFGSTEGAHFITSFRAFAHDNGMPGVRLKKDDGSFVDVVFSVPGIQELQTQLVLALHLVEKTSGAQH